MSEELCRICGGIHRTGACVDGKISTSTETAEARINIREMQKDTLNYLRRTFTDVGNGLEMGPISEDAVKKFFKEKIEAFIRERHPAIFAKEGTCIDAVWIGNKTQKKSEEGPNHDESSFDVNVPVGTDEEFNNSENFINFSINYSYIGDGVHPQIRSVHIGSPGNEEEFFTDRGIPVSL